MNNTINKLDQQFDFLINKAIGIAAFILCLVVLYLYIQHLRYYKYSKRILLFDLLFKPDKANSIYMLIQAAKTEYEEKNKYKANNKGYKVPIGVTVGKNDKNKYVCIPENTDFHCIISGASGAGKTSNIIVPTLRSWRSRAFYIDISGDILPNVAPLKKRKTVVFRPLFTRKPNDKNVRFVVYDPFYKLHKIGNPESAQFIAEVEKIASYVVPIPHNLGDTERYYRTQAQNILKASIQYFYMEYVRDFCRVCVAISTTPIKELISFLKSSSSSYIATNMAAFDDDMSAATISGINNSLNDFIRVFAARPELHKTVKKPAQGKQAFTPELLETEDICLDVPEHELDTLEPLMRLIICQLFQYCEERQNKTPLLLCLDELVRLGTLPAFGNALRTLRKRKIKIMAALQSLYDLIPLYEKDTNGILNNFTCKICLNATDTETQEFFAKLVGSRSYTNSSFNHSDTHENYGNSDRKDFIVDPPSLAYFAKQKKILFINGEGWEILKAKPYYEK